MLSIRYLPTIVLLAAMVFFAYDIVNDLLSENDGYLHIAVELLVFVAISAVLYRELKLIKELHQKIVQEQAKNARLAGELLSVINQQLVDWQLTDAEQEVALLLIKGLSMKEIAEVRNVKEKTVRLQASAIYGKSQCDGRHELSAFFIQDLMNSIPND